jgi:hypothetical protein
VQCTISEVSDGWNIIHVRPRSALAANMTRGEKVPGRRVFRLLAPLGD